MVSVKGRVLHGRLVVDEPTGLPEGTEVELVAVLEHDEDHLGPRERAALHRSLAAASQALDEDRLLDGEDVLKRLRARMR